MKVTIYYNGEYEDSFTFFAEDIAEARDITYDECAKRGWEHESLRSEIKE